MTLALGHLVGHPALHPLPEGARVIYSLPRTG